MQKLQPHSIQCPQCREWLEVQGPRLLPDHPCQDNLNRLRQQGLWPPAQEDRRQVLERLVPQRPDNKCPDPTVSPSSKSQAGRK